VNNYKIYPGSRLVRRLFWRKVIPARLFWLSFNTSFLVLLVCVALFVSRLAGILLFPGNSVEGYMMGRRSEMDGGWKRHGMDGAVGCLCWPLGLVSSLGIHLILNIPLAC
jgi:hypothetical protein